MAWRSIRSACFQRTIVQPLMLSSESDVTFQWQHQLSTDYCEALSAMFEARLIYEEKCVHVMLTTRITHVITGRFANSYFREETAFVFTLQQSITTAINKHITVLTRS